MGSNQPERAADGSQHASPPTGWSRDSSVGETGCRFGALKAPGSPPPRESALRGRVQKDERHARRAADNCGLAAPFICPSIGASLGRELLLLETLPRLRAEKGKCLIFAIQGDALVDLVGEGTVVADCGAHLGIGEIEKFGSGGDRLLPPDPAALDRGHELPDVWATGQSGAAAGGSVTEDDAAEL